MCYILDSAVAHINKIDGMETPMQECPVCQEIQPEDYSIACPVTNEKVCKTCLDSGDYMDWLCEYEVPSNISDVKAEIRKRYEDRFLSESKV